MEAAVGLDDAAHLPNGKVEGGVLELLLGTVGGVNTFDLDSADAPYQQRKQGKGAHTPCIYKD